MSEEVFDRNHADELTLRIAERLGKRQQKLACMDEWDAGTHQRMKWQPKLVIPVFAVAACLAAAVVILSPVSNHSGNLLEETGVSVPEFEAFRSAVQEQEEVAQLMSEQKYTEAMQKAEAALALSDSELQKMEHALQMNDDEVLADEKKTEQVVNGELRWAYIYLLLREGRQEEAYEQIKLYIKLPPDCISHLDEAQVLMKKLKEK